MGRLPEKYALGLLYAGALVSFVLLAVSALSNILGEPVLGFVAR